MDLELSEEILSRLRSARRVAMLTGAGISAESGIPTFRDAQTGYWAMFNPYDLASQDGFSRDPGRVWDWYRHRRELVAGAEPNAGHYAVAGMERLWPEFTLITQNIDGLHKRAGSTRMLTLHGNLEKVRCNRDQDHPRLDWLPDWDVPGSPIPRCSCGGLLRPDVVWFGEMLDPETIERAQVVSAESEVFFSVGTSSTVQPAALLPLFARERGATIVEVNTEPTSLSPMADAVLLGSAAQVLPAIVRVMRNA